MADKPADKKPNPASILGDIAGALGSAVGDIVRDVKQDLREMTPPAAAKPKADFTDTVRSAAAGLSHIEVGGEAPPPTALPVGGKITNPWSRIGTPGQIRVDAGFILADAEDGLRYAAALLMEKQAPYTLGIVMDEADRLEDANSPFAKLMAAEPRLFGAAGFGPRNLRDNPDELDEKLTALLNANPKLIAVGLLALDEPYAPYALAQQIRQMEVQLDVAADFGLPAFVGHRRSLGPLAQTLLTADTLPPLIWADPLSTPEEFELVKELAMHVLIRPELTHAANPSYRDLLLKVPEDKRLLGGGSALTSAESRSGHRGGPEGLAPTLKAYTQLMGREGESAQREQLEILNRNAQRLFYKPESAT